MLKVSRLVRAMNIDTGSYEFHRERHDAKYTDACIYTQDILIIKGDTDVSRRLPEDK